MTKMTLQATFTDGETITRNTAKGYTHAWKVTMTGHPNARRTEWSGFASSRAAAEKAAAAEGRYTRGYGGTVEVVEVVTA